MLNDSKIENITSKFLDMIKLPVSTGKKLNYLLVMPRQADMRSQYLFPTGFGLVSSSLKASGRNVFTFNMTYKENGVELLRQMIIDNKINVVATGGLSGQYALLREIIDAAKAVSSDIVTIVGGGIITAEPEVAMEALEVADYGVIGEGEIVINALAYALETGSATDEVEGVISRNKDGFVHTPPQHELTDLDCLPFPDYDGFNFCEIFERKYLQGFDIDEAGVSLSLSRSCPYNCTFCFHSSGKKYRRRTLDNVFKELEWLKSKFDFRRVTITDELFGNDFGYVRDFCERIKPHGFSYMVMTRLDRVNEEILGVLKNSGCSEITLGLEHINDKILKSMQKKTTFSMVEPAYNKALESGIKPQGNLLFGDVAETLETAREALNWWKTHRHYNINLAHIMTFPGSHIYKEACKRGIIKDRVKFLRDGCPIVNITNMSDSEWHEMKDEIARTLFLYESAESEPNVAEISRKLDLLSKRKVCVWPATHVTIDFIKSVSQSFYENCLFANIDKDSQLLRVCGKNQVLIHTPDIISKEQVELVICSRNRYFDEIRTICSSEYPSVKKVINILDIENLESEFQ
jgi:radical SAM superfamily enzyme YgiQ (UPF0313 family)